MAYIDTINLVTGDTLPQLKTTLRDANTARAGVTYDPEDSTTWATIDVTGATVRLKIRALGATTVLKDITGVVLDGPAGVIAFDFSNNSFLESGTYEAEVESTFATGGIQTTYDLLKIKVRDQIG